MSHSYKTIFITGTPGTGKTTVAKLLYDKLSAVNLVKLIDINEIAIENDFVLEYNNEKDYKVIDIDKLDKKLTEIINNDKKEFFGAEFQFQSKITIVEGHLSHLCSGADKVIVLRVNPFVLEKRLDSRNYVESKIRDNLESEALGLCSSEAYEKYGGSVNEIDSSNLSPFDVVNLCMDIIFDKKFCPVGDVDFMDYFLD
ncbi:MAG: adenylate kinase family protein [Methanobrevibacter sp.]|jgi:adenylate kinase|nr:adenylate kinase family protein [Methanobrevibacter sp.]